MQSNEDSNYQNCFDQLQGILGIKVSLLEKTLKK